MRYLLLLLILIPTFEIGVFLLAGNTIGFWPTISLIILTGILGAYLAKKQGMEAIRRAQLDMNYGQVPGEAILDGICILIGGIFLLTPGFISDTIGFLLLIPKTRTLLKIPLIKGMRRWIEKRNVTIIR